MSSSTRIAQDRVNETRSCQSAEEALASTDGVLLGEKSVVSPTRVQNLIGSLEGGHSQGWPNLSSWTLTTKARYSNCVGVNFGKEISKYRVQSGKEGIGSIRKLRRCNWNRNIFQISEISLPLLILSSGSVLDRAQCAVIILRVRKIFMMIPSLYRLSQTWPSLYCSSQRRFTPHLASFLSLYASGSTQLSLTF